MTRMLFLISVSLLLLKVSVGIATAQAPVTNSVNPAEKRQQEQERIFYSEQVLKKSIAEIGIMPEAELRSLTTYLVECTNTTTQETHACSAAEEAYLIEFGAKRSIDDWIIARSGLDQRERSDAEVYHKAPPVDLDKMIKSTKIEFALRDAINQRFKELRSKQRSP